MWWLLMSKLQNLHYIQHLLNHLFLLYAIWYLYALCKIIPCHRRLKNWLPERIHNRRGKKMFYITIPWPHLCVKIRTKVWKIVFHLILIFWLNTKIKRQTLSLHIIQTVTTHSSAEVYLQADATLSTTLSLFLSLPPIHTLTTKHKELNTDTKT